MGGELLLAWSPFLRHTVLSTEAPWPSKVLRQLWSTSDQILIVRSALPVMATLHPQSTHGSVSTRPWTYSQRR